jgi:inner membrane protein
MTGDVPAAERPSPLLRLALLALLVVLLQVPIFAIARLVHERQTRRDAAVEEVSSKWGRRQQLTGPVLVLPYKVREARTRPDHTVVVTERVDRAMFLPEELTVRSTLAPETRKRGIFAIPVYALGLEFAGTFAPPDLAALGIAPGDVDWAHAEVAVGVSDVRAIQERASLAWGDTPVEFLPGVGGLAGVEAGIHAPVPLAAGGAPVRFAFPLRLRGSVGLGFAPAGRQTDVHVASTWPGPSFTGEWLPSERNVTRDGFTAHWSIPYLGRNVPQQWRGGEDHGRRLAAAQFGLELVESVDAYRMTDRSVKYALLFLVMTLLAVWLAEVLAGIAVHPIQSLFLCTALCLFYLLELSLAEHIGFVPAYLAASAAVSVMIGAYGCVALGTVGRGVALGAGIAALYGYLYVVLVNEDHALLVGSLGLFALLALAMFATRRVDWNRLERRSAPLGRLGRPAGD